MQERMANQHLEEQNIRSKTTRSLTIILVSSMNYFMKANICTRTQYLDKALNCTPTAYSNLPASLVEGRANAIYSTSVPLVDT